MVVAVAIVAAHAGADAVVVCDCAVLCGRLDGVVEHKCQMFTQRLHVLPSGSLNIATNSVNHFGSQPLVESHMVNKSETTQNNTTQHDIGVGGGVHGLFIPIRSQHLPASLSVNLTSIWSK